MEHTKVKLQYRKNPWDEGKYDLRPVDRSPWAYAPIAHVKGDKRVTGGNGEANARRLAACWNALDGVPTEWLENYVAGGAENLLQENAALLTVLRKLVEWNDKYPSHRIYSHHAIIKIAEELDEVCDGARTLLAKHGEEA